MGGSDVIPHMHLPNIESSTLVKIVAFCLHYQCVEPMRPIPKPVPSSMHDCVQKWYADYVDLQDSSRMMDLTIAAKYLAIQPLLDLTCGKIATSMAGKTHDELRAIFGVFNSSTPNE
jgi:S-phase kinase-associated protein 1